MPRHSVKTYLPPSERASGRATLVLLRIDPPVDPRYLHTTYLLDVLAEAGVRVVNHPAGIRALHEKIIALHLPELCPSTLVTTAPREVEEFVGRVGRAVVKPVDGFAGIGVWLLERGPSCRALAESATRSGTRHVIVQEYLPSVADGNKRLFLLDGEIIGAVLRRPSADDFRIGPPVAVAEPDCADRRIVAALAPRLAAHGIALAGLDVIAGQLIEVNVTCPGGMQRPMRSSAPISAGGSSVGSSSPAPPPPPWKGLPHEHHPRPVHRDHGNPPGRARRERDPASRATGQHRQPAAHRPADRMFIAIRAHGNAAEYIPTLSVLLIVCSMLDDGWWLNGLAVAAAAARLLHAVGVLSSESMATHGPVRDIGALGTWTSAASPSA